MTDVLLRNSVKDSRYTSLSEEIRLLLLEAFIDGELIPGTRINDMELAKRLGVSRTPVREALRGLQTMGIIETLPARITRVVKLSKDEFDHVQMVWGSLVHLLLADVIGNVPAEKRQEMMRLCEKLADATEPSEHATIGFRFFHALGELTKNTFLRESVHHAACRMRLGYHDEASGSHHHFRFTFAQAQEFLGALTKSSHDHASRVLQNIVGEKQSQLAT